MDVGLLPLVELAGEVLLAQDLRDAAGGGDVARGQRRQRRHVELVDVAGVGDRLTVAADEQHRLGVGIPSELARRPSTSAAAPRGTSHRGRSSRSSPSRHGIPETSTNITRVTVYSSDTGRHLGSSQARAPIASRQHLHLTPAVDGAGQGHLVGVLQLATDGDAGGDAGGPDAQRAQQLGQVDGRGLPLDAGAGRQDDLLLGRRLPPQRRTSSATRRSSGPMPSSGESTPCRTW